jgi:two-component system chemotaxis sensor kinase CheA
MSLQDKELLTELISESQEHLSNIEPLLLELEQKGENIEDEKINSIFRAVHSIKGGFGFFGLKNIIDLSHTIENILSKIRDKKLKITVELIDAILKGIDKLTYLINNIDESENISIEEELQRLSIFTQDNPKANNTLQDKKDTLVKQGDNIDIFGKHNISKQKIIDALKEGKLLYQINVYHKTKFNEENLPSADLFKEWESLGDVLDILVDKEKNSAQKESSKEGTNLSVIFATVLEPDLISQALNISQEQIYLIDSQKIKQELKLAANNKNTTDSTAEKSNSKTIKKDLINKEATSDTFKEDSLRVRISLLNQLMNLAGELVLSRNQLLQNFGNTIDKYINTNNLFNIIHNELNKTFSHFSIKNTVNGKELENILKKESENLFKNILSALKIKLSEISELYPIIQNIDQVTSLLQENIMQTRLQPISILFSKFPRIVRDLAKKCNKNITLITEGQDVELDKSIIELLSDPLTHLIRNSVDHGIEDPQTRKKLGKNETGQIILKAFHESGKVNIQIIDDGAGINTQKVKDKAIQKGLVSKEQAEKLNDSEIYQFILLPGFSTAEKVSDISGRGVGMDVVKTNIEKLGGTIDISSAINKGTTITLQLPLTLAIISALIIKTEERLFAIPQVSIEELVLVRSHEITKKIERIGNSEVYRLRGKLLPLVRLANILKIPATYIDPQTKERKIDRRLRWSDRRGVAKEEDELDTLNTQNLTENRRKGEKDRRKHIINSLKIIVLRVGENLFGLVVDEVINSEEIVVKPISSYLKQCGCYAGATIMGDGRVIMIIDPNGIVKIAELKFTDLKKEEEKSKLKEKIKEDFKEYLIIDIGTQERLALELSCLSRIDKVEISHIEQVGTKEFVRYSDLSIPLIRLHNYLPLSAPQPQTDSKKHQMIIIPKTEYNVIGIAVEKLFDIVKTNVKIQQDYIKTNGITGSTIINNKLVLILDINEILFRAQKEFSNEGK